MKKIKSSMLIVMIAIGFASFVSCNNNKNAQTADGSDSTAVVNEALEDQEVAEMSAFINSVASCLDSIQVQENMIFNHPEAHNRQAAHAYTTQIVQGAACTQAAADRRTHCEEQGTGKVVEADYRQPAEDGGIPQRTVG